MHHVVLTCDFKPKIGGIANYLHGIASGLAESGRVTVLAWDIEPSESFEPDYEVRYVRGRSRRLGRRWGDGVSLIRKLNSAYHVFRQRGRARRNLEQLLSRVEDDEPVRVYLGIWTGMAHWWCARLREIGVPYWIFAYGREVVRPLDPLRDYWRRVDFRAAETVFACSGATASLVEERMDVSDTVTVHPGVTLPDDIDTVRARAEELRDELEIGYGDRVVVTVGRLVRRKGIHRVLEAVASLSASEQEVHYLVAGAGPERDRLVQRSVDLGIENNTHFLGYVDDPTKWAVYEVGDVFAMPHSSMRGDDWEGFGIVFVEAAVMGVPVIAGKSGGAIEAVENGRTGLLVDPSSPDQVRVAIKRLLENRDLSCSMGQRARERAKRKFSWDEAAELVRNN